MVTSNSSSCGPYIRASGSSAHHIFDQLAFGHAVEFFDPRKWDRENHGAFRDSYQRSKFLSKFNDGDPKLLAERTRVALSSFLEAEARCKETNYLQPHITKGNSPYACIISIARRKICDVLGDFCLDELITCVDFGPGATTSLRRRDSDLWYKFQGSPDATHWCLPYIDAAQKYLGDIFPFGPESVKLRSTSKIVTVPKNSKTERVIAIEPDLNMFFQKGVGTMLKRRLRRAGVDLFDQSVNQRLAKQGSIDGSLCTIDLKAASDTVSTSIVELLFPTDWYTHLSNLRTPSGVLPSGEIVNFQKFSSMGNGFTFEVESLIFWALTQACLTYYADDERRVGIYGDDIICSSSIAQSLITVLFLAGFDTNSEKTYVDGPFRESCGKHYFNGHDVTPFYLRKPVTDLQTLFLLHNNYLRWVSLDGNSIKGETEWFSVQFLRSLAPQKWRRPRIPIFGYGDGAFSGFFDECLPKRIRQPYQGYRAKVLVDRSKFEEKQDLVILRKCLWLLRHSVGFRVGPNAPGSTLVKLADVPPESYPLRVDCREPHTQIGTMIVWAWTDPKWVFDPSL